MKLTIPKNRIVPLILLAITGTLISLISGLYYISKIAESSYVTTLETYDELSEHTAMMLRQNIEDKYKALQLSADLVGQVENFDKEQIMSILPLIANKETCLDLAIVGVDGRGYNLNGLEVNIFDEVYFKEAIHGQVSNSNKISYLFDNEPIVVYAVPIYSHNKTAGALIATTSARLERKEYIDNSGLEDSLVYILNENNDLVSYFNGSTIADFNYEQITTNGFLHEDFIKNKTLDLNDFYHKFYKQENEYVWYRKPLEINNWTMLVGKYDVMEPIAQEILKISNMMWTIIMLGIFLLFLLLIISQRRSNRKLIQMLYLDPVTGGGNWYRFRLDVNKILNSRQFQKKKFALINFDINRFKIINDAYGYQKGDEVLKDIYNILKKWVKSGEPFTRYAADQFFIMMSYHEEQEINQRLYDLNDRIKQLRYTKTLKIFFGVYMITERKDSIDRMGDFAGIAKHQMKESNDGMISFFDDKVREKILIEEEIEKNMHDALKNNEFVMYLQPKYTTREEAVTGAEALVRWINKDGTMLSPGYFIPVFEKNGFIMDLDNYMLRKVCVTLRDWLDRGYEPLPISVNISRIHFTNPLLAEEIKNIVDEYKIPHELIELELTESAFLQSKQTLIRTVIQLKKYGFLVSMDDFGAGYSSLNSLKDLPLDIVKLDGELFRITEEAERGFTVIRNTISMAKDLHMKVVAECIETREQVEFLCTVGCDIIQGYYYAKPMSTDQFERKYFEAVK